ncbi:Spo0E family sporulation regulatory protein-aspartic acid phosphatase [Ammoniphilus sp. 3BR4]|uniref:Spo0E family sporulation regulatory protein-aspartic acid phosphatase n=1 Tax=Ammoniphilus sp. 3BR4 TaxID=3158265 RepID=UPI003467792A
MKNSFDLRKSIDECRRDMYDLERDKGINHPEVIKISQRLDEKILLIQKMMLERKPLST